MKTSRKLTFSLWLTLITALAFVDSVNAGVEPDLNFRAPLFAQPQAASRTVLLPDGKFLLFFNTDTLTDQRTGAITRYLPNGALDTSFSFSRVYKFVGAAAPLASGKLYISAAQNAYGTTLSGTALPALEKEQILRLNGGGSIDSSFNAVTVGASDRLPDVREIRVQPDAKVLVAGFFTTFSGAVRNGIVRLLTDGTIDSSFAPITISGGGGLVYSSALQPDGKILIGGNFASVNGVSNLGVARLNADGSLDSSFQGAGFMRANVIAYPIREMAVQSDGKIVMSCRFRFGTSPNFQYAPLFRLNADGSPDTGFTYVTTIANAQGRSPVLQPDGKIVAAGRNSIYRFNTDGSLDSSFRQPVVVDASYSWSDPFPGQPVTVSLQPDGRVLFGGLFTDVDPPGVPGYSHFGVARLNSDGTLDTSLTPSHKTGYEATPDSFSRLPDGSTLVCFSLQGFKIDPAIPYNLGRLLPDGSLDPNFTLSSSNPNSFLSGRFLAEGFTQLTDGNFLVFGAKGEYTFGDYAYGKVQPSGAEDTAFIHDPATPTFQNAKGLADGKILLSAGNDAQSTVEAAVSRLGADGLVDGAFQLDASIRSGQVLRDGNGRLDQMYAGSRPLAVQPDGRILFECLLSDRLFHLVRLNADGSIDGSFTETTFVPFDLFQDFPVVFDPSRNETLQPSNGVWSASFPLLDAQIQSDGRFVIAGQFKLFNRVMARGLVRLQSNGAVDTTFAPGGGAQWTQTIETDTFFPSVQNMALQADGKFLLTGTFEAFDGVPAPGIASLNPNGSVDTSFVAPVIGDKHASGNILARQPDGSFLLSGAYHFPNETISPSFIHLLATVNMSGTVSYCSNPVPGPVPNVTLTLTGSMSRSTLSNASGNYTFSSLTSGGSYTVTPTKAALAPASAGINTTDVIVVQRHFLSVGPPLTGCRLTAADVTGDTVINTNDVIAIQRFFLGQSTGIANTGRYQFSPVNRTYSGVVNDQTGQNYDTLILGDVATPFAERLDGTSSTKADDDTNASEVPATVAAIALPNIAVDPSKGNFIASVTTTGIDAKNKLVGFQGDFTFDDRVVTFQSDEPVQKAGLTGGNWNVSGNVLPGAGPIRTLRISAFSNDFAPLSGSGTLFELRITRVSKAPQGTQLTWAAAPDHFIFIDADLNTQKPGHAAPGSVTASRGRK